MPGGKGGRPRPNRYGSVKGEFSTRAKEAAGKVKAKVTPKARAPAASNRYGPVKGEVSGPDVLGTGTARQAAKAIGGRQRQIDDAVDRASGYKDGGLAKKRRKR